MRIFSACVPAVLAGGLLAVATAASAQTYPDKPIHVIVNMSPGGGADTVARIVTAKVSELIGQPIVVEDKPGANGTIGIEFVSRADADGYTLAWITNAHTITPSVMKLSYDPVKDFEPITMVSQAPDVLVVRPQLGVNTVAELIAKAKAEPGKLNFASPGTATSPFVEATLFKTLSGIDIVHVPYKGGGEIMPALLGDAVQMYFSTISTALPHIKSGDLKALAVSTKTRSPILPDVPTIAEAANLPNFEGSDWLGVLAPKGTPKEVVDKLNKAFVEAIQSEEVKGELTKRGWSLIGNSPDEFAKVIADETARWAAQNG